MKKILRANNLRDFCIFTLGINSGLRISDILSLRVNDVIDNKGRIKERISIREKKTGKIKDFPLSDTVLKSINLYIKECCPTDFLFPSKKGGGPLTRQQAYRIINGAARSVGIKEQIGTHTLRKTFGYWAFKSCADITRIQKLMNHSSPAITLAYIGITRDDLDNVYLSLNL